MTKILIVSDFHIREKDLEEIELVFSEILSIKEKEGIQEIWIPGDIFDTTKPNPLELDCFSRFIKKFDSAIIISAKSHETISAEQSVLNHFSILNPQYKVYYNQHIVEYTSKTKFLLGHYFLQESLVNIGAEYSLKELKDKYRFIFLGHQHFYQELAENAFHLGSVRFIRFDEVKYPKKYIGILEIGDLDKSFTKIPLKTPYPMIDIILRKTRGNLMNNNELDKILPELPKSAPNFDSGNEANNDRNRLTKANSQAQTCPNTYHFGAVSDLLSFTAALPEKTKVKVIIEDFDLFKEYLVVERDLEKKFYVYKRENRFDLITKLVDNSNSVVVEKKKDMVTSLTKFLELKKIDPEIQGIIKEEIK